MTNQQFIHHTNNSHFPNYLQGHPTSSFSTAGTSYPAHNPVYSHSVMAPPSPTTSPIAHPGDPSPRRHRARENETKARQLVKNSESEIAVALAERKSSEPQKPKHVVLARAAELLREEHVLIKRHEKRIQDLEQLVADLRLELERANTLRCTHPPFSHASPPPSATTSNFAEHDNASNWEGTLQTYNSFQSIPHPATIPRSNVPAQFRPPPLGISHTMMQPYSGSNLPTPETSTSASHYNNQSPLVRHHRFQ